MGRAQVLSVRQVQPLPRPVNQGEVGERSEPGEGGSLSQPTAQVSFSWEPGEGGSPKASRMRSIP